MFAGLSHAVSNAEVLSGQDNGIESTAKVDYQYDDFQLKGSNGNLLRCEAVRHVESGVILENQSANLLTRSHGGSPESNSDNLR